MTAALCHWLCSNQLLQLTGGTGDCPAGGAASTPWTHLVKWARYKRKWARYKRKSGSFIQPVGLPVPAQPTGPPLRMWSLKRLRGKMKNGGTRSPWALPARATVTRVPLSAEGTEPTCFCPIWATTRSGTWTVVTPVNHIQLHCLPYF